MTGNLSSQELLQYAIENGIIDTAYLRVQIEMQKRKELLEKHPYDIWEGKNGNWYTYLPDKEKGRILKKRTTKKCIEDIIVEYWKEQMENPTIKEVFTEWNDRKLELNKISKATHFRYKQVFDRHYDNFGKLRIKSVEENEILDFLEEQVPRFNLTAKAFSNLKTITRGFLKRAKKRNLVCFEIENMLKELDTSDTKFKIVIKDDCEEVFNEDELPIVLDYLIKNCDLRNLGILVMFLSGIRIGELVTLKHTDFDGLSFKILRTETRYVDENKKTVYGVKEFPKTEAGVRTAIIPKTYQWVVDRLKAYNPNSEYIFVDEKGQRMTTNCIRRRMERMCAKLNIVPKSPHKARKTYGTILLDNKLDNQLIISVMGHTDVLCTEKHYHRNRKSVDKKVDIISNIPEFAII